MRGVRRKFKPWVGPVYGVACLSGIAGLGYEMVWTQQLGLPLGHEAVAVLAVVSAFFGGLALGGWLLSERLRGSQRPALWFAALEGMIGGWALLLAQLMPWLSRLASRCLDVDPSPLRHWMCAFLGTFLVLLPATFAMGATLPALQRMLRLMASDRNRLAGLYAVHTFGAVVGTLLGTFVWVPRLGYTATLFLLAGCNGLAAALGLWLDRTAGRTAPGSPASLEAPEASAQGAPALTGAIALLGPRSRLWMVGLLGITYEVVVVRVLSQVLPSTVYTFGVLLSVYLLGTAIGAALLQWRSADGSSCACSRRYTAVLLSGTASATLLGALVLWRAPALFRYLQTEVGAGTLSEMGVGLAVFLVPTAAMGALFSQLVRETAPRLGMGRALAWNTAGAALGPLLSGVVLIPALGARATLLGIGLSYLLLAVAEAVGRDGPAVSVLSVSEVRGPSRARWLLPLTALGLSALLWSAASTSQFITVPSGGQLLRHMEGSMASVAVVSDPNGARYLKVNNQFTMGGTASRFSDQRQAHLPLLLHAEPRRALFLGVGTGITLDALRHYPKLEVTAVELVPEVLSMLSAFDVELEQWPRPPTLLVGDARRFVLSSTGEFDVIVADLFHPWKDGAAGLYTLEHFQTVRARLAPGGLFCQWLPLYQLDLSTLKMIMRTFLRAFPHARLYLGHLSLQQPILALVGTVDWQPNADPDWLQDRVHHPPLQQALVKLRLNSNFALFGSELGDQAALARFAGSGELNTDDRPLVAYSATTGPYGKWEHSAAARLLAVVEAMAAPTDSETGEVARRRETFDGRLKAYRRARDAFLRAGRDVTPSADPAHMLAQVRQPLLSVVRMSPDFIPAYAPLLSLAQGLYPQDPTTSRSLLIQLAEASPQRPEARAMRQRLFGE